MRAHEIINRCRRLATFSESPTGLLRTFLSPPMREVHSLLGQWMEAAGMRVRVDAAGNLRGVYPGGPRCLLLGSHLDTVPDAGAFDGVLGVVLAIAQKLAIPIRFIGIGERAEDFGVFNARAFATALVEGAADSGELAAEAHIG